MRCLSCTTVNPIGNRFCEGCGKQLQTACPRCGHDVAASARFCGNCGTALVAGTPLPGGADPAPRWGELKQATVLFADIVGSTELVAGLDPEQAMGRMRPAVLRMRHSVERFGGTVVRTLGDGVMALFGVPHTLEGHALLACQAAVHMHKAFESGGDGLAIRIGLHSGQIASDPQDAEDGRGGGAHGLTIHLASRVMTLAQSGGICMTEACRALAGPSCETVPMGMHALKGIRDPTALHELTGIGPAVRGPAAGAPPPTNFRGRERELAQLVAALDDREGRAPKVIGVAGEPGAGKSRLCREFSQLCAGRGIPVFEVGAQLYGHALPLQPILELFRVHFFGIGPRDDASVARSRIAARFASLQVTEADLELLYDFFGVAAPGASSQAAGGARLRQARLLALTRELVRQDAGAQRVILIEDLHWLDDASEEFVSALIEAVAGTRTLLLLNYRLAYRSPWSQVPYFEQLDLGELPAADMDALVAELLVPVSTLPDICRLVCRRSGGNPFFAEELVRALAESGLLDAETGLPLGGLETVEHALPATVEAVIGARLDRVGEPEKTLLQMCAIIGKEIPLAVLEHVASPLASQIEKGLDGLCRAGLILPQPAVGGRRFAFRHPLIQEVAYGSQLKVRRGQVHSSVAAAMELYYAEQLDEYAGLIAYHYEAAGQPLDAARHTARAARWLAATNSARAIVAWRKVRSLLDGCPRTAEVDGMRAFASGRIVYLGWREGLSLDEVQLLMAEAIDLASEADHRLVQLLLFAHGRLMQSTGGPADGYVESVCKAIALSQGDAKAPADPGRAATLQLALSHAYTWAGLLTEALQANDLALQGLARIDRLDREFIGFSVEQWAFGIRVRLLNKMGRFEEARAYLQRLTLKPDAGGDPVMRQIAHYAYVDHAWCNGDAELAREHAAHVVRIADDEASPYSKVLAHSCRAVALQVAGELEAAKARFAEALQLVRDSRVAVDFEAEILAGLAECLLELGEFPQAQATAQDAVNVARLRSNRVAECRALIVWASALAAGSDGAPNQDAMALLLDAQALLARTGAQVLERPLAAARASCMGLGTRLAGAVSAGAQQ